MQLTIDIYCAKFKLCAIPRRKSIIFLLAKPFVIIFKRASKSTYFLFLVFGAQVRRGVVKRVEHISTIVLVNI